jgi:excisionase family DNA binding protein
MEEKGGSPVTLPRLLDAKEVAELLGISRNRLYELGRRGMIPTVRISRGQVRYREDELLRWIERSTTPNGAGHNDKLTQ